MSPRRRPDGGVRRFHTVALCHLVEPDAGALLRSLTQFSHSAADTIVNGSATAHMAPTDHADRRSSL